MGLSFKSIDAFWIQPEKINYPESTYFRKYHFNILISIIYAQCIIANIYHMWICLLSNNSNLDIIEWIRTRNFKNGEKKNKKEKQTHHTFEK